MEVDFDGVIAKQDPLLNELTPVEWRKMSKANQKAFKDIEAAGAFLKEHETAKIIISIDTHCLEENGLLIYSDKNTNDLRPCTLETVGFVLE